MEWKNSNNEKPENFFKKNSDGDEVSGDVFLHNGVAIATGYYNFTQKKWISTPTIEGISNWFLPTVPEMHLNKITVNNYIEKLKVLEEGETLKLEEKDRELFHAIESKIRLNRTIIVSSDPQRFSFTISS